MATLTPTGCRYMAGCRFRETCSYHHGDPTICYCTDPYCMKGHPNRAGAGKSGGKGGKGGKGRGKEKGIPMPGIDNFSTLQPGAGGMGSADAVPFAMPCAIPASPPSTPAVKRGGFTITINPDVGNSSGSGGSSAPAPDAVAAAQTWSPSQGKSKGM